jgi:methylmalonyl-CoA mutase
MTIVESSRADFPARSRDDWLALAGKTLKGGGLERLRKTTPDGLMVEPLYEAAEGATFMVRRPSADPARPWDIRASVAHPDPDRANAQGLADLEGGAASLLITVDPARGRGLAAVSADVLKRALDGVLLDLAPVALDAGFAGPTVARWLADAAAGAAFAPLAFHLDPLGAFAEAGASAGPIAGHLEAAARTALDLSVDFSRASLFLASGRVVHEAGGTPAQELGFAAASAIAYARAANDAGLPAEQALNRMALGLAVDAEPLATIAKMRAARAIWSRLAAAYGSNAPAVIEARSSRRMLTRLDAMDEPPEVDGGGLRRGGRRSRRDRTWRLHRCDRRTDRVCKASGPQHATGPDGGGQRRSSRRSRGWLRLGRDADRPAGPRGLAGVAGDRGSGGRRPGARVGLLGRGRRSSPHCRTG